MDKEDRFYKIKLQTIKTERLQQLEAAKKFEQQKKKKLKKGSKLIDFVDRKSKALTNQKLKVWLILMKNILVALDQPPLKKVQKLVRLLDF